MFLGSSAGIVFQPKGRHAPFSIHQEPARALRKQVDVKLHMTGFLLDEGGWVQPQKRAGAIPQWLYGTVLSGPLPSAYHNKVRQHARPAVDIQVTGFWTGVLL